MLEKLSLWVVIYMLVVKLYGLVDRITTNETTIIALSSHQQKRSRMPQVIIGAKKHTGYVPDAERAVHTAAQQPPAVGTELQVSDPIGVTLEAPHDRLCLDIAQPDRTIITRNCSETRRGMECDTPDLGPQVHFTPEGASLEVPEFERPVEASRNQVPIACVSCETCHCTTMRRKTFRRLVRPPMQPGLHVVPVDLALF